MPMLRPVNVFTPGRPPLDATNVYASRVAAEADFDDAIRHGMVPIVFGEFGVGKTSLVRHRLLRVERAGRLVYLESVAGKSMSDVLQRVLEAVGYRIETGISTESHSGSSQSLAGKLGAGFGAFRATIEAKSGKHKSTAQAKHEELVVKMPSDGKVLDICESAGLNLVIDELHKADALFLADLSDFIKARSNKTCKAFQVILVGTSSDAAKLVDLDAGVDRLLDEVHLRAMSGEEAGFVVDKGMDDLRISITEEVRESIVRTSVGSPAIVQSLCLDIAEAAFDRNPRSASIADFRNALRTYVRRKSKRLNAAYAKAIETTGSKRYRKQVLHAMAAIEDEYVTMEQLVRQVSHQLGEEIPSTALSGPLKDLKSDGYGRVLKDVERHVGGERVWNYTTFVDPGMKSFIRMHGAGEEQGVFPD